MPTPLEVREWMLGYIAENLRPQQLAEVVERLNTLIIERVPALRDRELQRDLEASTRAQLRAVFTGLSEDNVQIHVPVEAHALAQTIARRGLELRVLLQIYRAGQEAAVQYLTAILDNEELPREMERAVILRMFERSTTWLSASTEVLTDTYTAERERGLRDAFTRRSETVRAILEGDDVDVDEATRQLDYRVAGGHLAFVLWAEDTAESGDAIRTLDRVAARIGAAVHATRLLTIPSGARGLWAWAGVDAEPDFERLPNDGDVRVAFGAGARGLDGFRSSHREALAARQVAESAPHSRTRIRYRDVEIAYLASADRAAMRTLVARELSGIDGADANSARLRETLQAYLSCNRSPEAAARLLGVHKNTVRYRVQRIEELLGHDIASSRLPIEVALQCVQVFGTQS